MNRHTPNRTKFVLYSIRELVAGAGAGFWSNDQGWVEFRLATQFTVATVPSCNMPLTTGQDAKWMMWEPTPVADADGSAPLQIELPLVAQPLARRSAMGEGNCHRA